MTAIEKYTRLEALGQWKESPDQPAREVVVSFENETLVLSNLDEKPLCHWAMAATFRISLDGSKAVYTPDTEGFETLEIDDAQMVEAIAQVSSAAVTAAPRTPWLRWVFLLFLVTAIAAISFAAPFDAFLAPECETNLDMKLESLFFATYEVVADTTFEPPFSPGISLCCHTSFRTDLWRIL